MKRQKQELSQCPEKAMVDFKDNNDIPALAKKTGASKNIIYDRLNPDRDQKLGYLEAIGHSHICDDDTLLHAWASDRGYGLFKTPEGSSGEEEMLDLVLIKQGLGGCFASTFHSARSDGVIDQVECDDLMKLINKEMDALATLKAEISGQVRKIK